MRLDTRAAGIAGGTVLALGVFALTLLLLVRGAVAGDAPPLGIVLFGYSVSVAGAFIGALWGYAYGFLLGALSAFVYNLAAAPSAPPGAE